MKLETLDEDQVKAVYHLGLTWDTLGWARFRLGDIEGAEKYVHAAWVLNQTAEVGDHLGQIYERQGKKTEAIHAYRLALAVNRDLEETQQRLEALGGAADDGRPTLRHNASAGKAQVLPEHELSQMRTAQAPQLGQHKGNAEFFVLFSAKGVEDVSYLTGSENLKKAGEMLKKQPYQAPFPGSGSGEGGEAPDTFVLGADHAAVQFCIAAAPVNTTTK